MVIKRIISLLLITILCFGSLSFASDTFDVKTTEYVALRDGIWGTVIAHASKNTTITVQDIEKDSYGVDWYKVSHDGVECYISSLSTSRESYDLDDFNVITTDFVYVRDSAWGSKIGYLNKNTIKTVYGIRKDRYGNIWYRIWYKGKAGYVKKNATSNNLSSESEFIVKLTDYTGYKETPWGEIKGIISKNTSKTVYGTRVDRFGYTWYRVYKDSKPYFISALSTSKKLENTDEFLVITTDITNVRNKVRGTVLGYIKRNVVKTVYGVRLDKYGNTWYRIWFNGNAAYIKKAPTRKKLKKTPVHNVLVMSKHNVRKHPWGKVLGQIEKDTVKTVYGLRVDRFGNTWYRVWFNGGAAFLFREDKYKHNLPLDTPGMLNVEGFIEASTIDNPNILNNVKKESLINKYNRLPEGFTQDNLKLINSRSDRDIYLESEAADAFEALRQDALSEGIYFVVFSGYRPYNEQKEIYDEAYEKDRPYAVKSIAYPGSSEHSSGYAMDISYNTGFPEDFYSTPQGKFLEKNAHKYGFILRYPEDKVNVTNYKYESWHYRYVGVKLATILKNRGITLEEYYGTDEYK